MSERVISSVGSYTGYDAAVSIDAANDYMLIQQSGVYKKINRNIIMGVTGTPADLSTVQTLTNKVIGSTNSVTQLDSIFTLQDNSDPTKQAQFQLSGITAGQTRTYTLPDASDTLVNLASAQTLTNKTLTSPAISGGTLSNATITVNSIAEFTAANGVTVDGMSIKDGKLNTNNSVVTANITDAAVTPAKLLAGTGSGWDWQTWSPSWTNLTTGNGTLNYAKYTQTGKTVFFRIKFTLGSTSSVAGNIIFTLPVTANAQYAATSSEAFGTGVFTDSGSANYPIGVCWQTSTTAGMFIWSAGSSITVITATTNLIPFTWTTGDRVSASGFYEAA